MFFENIVIKYKRPDILSLKIDIFWEIQLDLRVFRILKLYIVRKNIKHLIDPIDWFTPRHYIAEFFYPILWMSYSCNTFWQCIILLVPLFLWENPDDAGTIKNLFIFQFRLFLRIKKLTKENFLKEIFWYRSRGLLKGT